MILLIMRIITSSAGEPIDWLAWWQRWEIQQGIHPEREGRFQAMLDLLGALAPPECRVIDLGAGPGSFCQRVLTRFPNAEALAVDLDPVLLTMGRAALDELDGRLTWVDADLREPTWSASLGDASMHAVVSTTALHYLPIESLCDTYRAAFRLLRSGGVLLNGDRVRLPEARAVIGRTLRLLADRYRDERAMAGVETWDAWWKALAEVPAAAALFAERERRFKWDSKAPQPTFDVHVAALFDAGFAEVDIAWQERDARVVIAVKR